MRGRDDVDVGGDGIEDDDDGGADSEKDGLGPRSHKAICPGLEEDVERAGAGGRRARCGRQSCVESGILESSGRDRGS